MSAAAVWAGVALGCAVLLVLPARPRLPRGLAPGGRAGVVGGVGGAGADPVLRYRLLWAVSAALGGLTLGPGVLGSVGPLPPRVTGVVVGAVAGAVMWVLVGRAEPAAQRRRRESAARELPHLVELFAAALTAGTSPAQALSRACAALPGAAAEELVQVNSALALGVPAGEVWGQLAGHPALAPLGRTMARAQASGAPVVDAVRRLADDLAAAQRLDVEDRARAVGVRAAVPLGLCLLPAFLLLGIVPLVAGAVSAIRW